jgi:phage baseplate assembly protein gpV
VSSVNYEAGRIRVLYTDKNDAVTAELPLESFEYDMPRVGERVYVIHQSNGVEKGLVLSRYWHDDEAPPEYGPHIWRKEMRDFPTFPEGTYFKFDRNTHTLTIRVVGSPGLSVNIIADKDVHVTTGGNVVVNAQENVTINALENVTVNAQENVTVNSQENVTIDAQKDIKVTARDNVKIKAEQDVTVQAAENVTVDAAKNVSVSAAESLTVTAAENITLTAKDINLEGETHIGLHAEQVEANGNRVG